MSHSLVRIHVHALWSTKLWKPLIPFEIENIVHDYMTHQFEELGCRVHKINGMPDHVHCFFQLNPQKALMDVIKQVKGSTSYFINDQELIEEKFLWQTGYWGISVSDCFFKNVYNYIHNQKKHHQKKTFQQEYEELLKEHGNDFGSDE